MAVKQLSYFVGPVSSLAYLHRPSRALVEARASLASYGPLLSGGKVVAPPMAAGAVRSQAVALGQDHLCPSSSVLQAADQAKQALLDVRLLLAEDLREEEASAVASGCRGPSV